MTDFSSAFFLFTRVHIPWFDLRFAGVRSLLFMISLSSFPFLDMCCLQLFELICSFALKSSTIITSLFCAFRAIWWPRAVKIPLAFSIFSILDLNIQSLSSKFDAFTAFLSLLDEKGIRFSAICLQETWLSDKHETSIFNLPGYRLIHAGKSCSDCGGLMIYLSDLFSCNVKHVYNDNSSLWEGLFIEVQGGTLESKLIIGNIYRPPRHSNNNATIENFLTEITPVISNIAKNSCNIVVSGDFNIDLLQINDRVKYQKYFDVFLTNSLFPLITLPTRESKHSSTLIDQIFCKLKNFRDSDSSGILIRSLSDHYPCFALLDICKKKKHKPKFITINNKN